MLHSQGIQVLFRPLGIAKTTVSTTPVGLPSVPTSGRIRRVVIRALNQPIEYRDDGTTPDGSNGFRLLADEVLVYDGEDPSAVQLIRASSASGDADVRVAYYGT